MTGEIQHMEALREYRLHFARWSESRFMWIRGTDKVVSTSEFLAGYDYKRRNAPCVIISCQDVTQN